MNKTKNETKIIAEAGRQELLIIREFEAPRELLFKAYTDPALLVKWWGPSTVNMRIEKMDCKAGGTYRQLYKVSEDFSFGITGVYHEVTAPERMILTSEMENLPEKGHVCLETIRFEKLPGNRTRITTQDVFQSVADRDAAVASGMEHGLVEGNNRLDNLLESLK